jgi:hypothetical protein
MERTPNETDVTSLGRGEPERASVSVLGREAWIRRYTDRVLGAWFRQEAPLGLARTYANWIAKELSGFYGQPLMRAFIERTFRGGGDCDA